MSLYYNFVIVFNPAIVTYSVSLQLVDNLVKTIGAKYCLRTDYLGYRSLAYKIKGQITAYYFSLWFYRSSWVLQQYFLFVNRNTVRILRHLLLKSNNLQLIHINDY
ncbi:30S ribosomal protein S6 [Candidatus Vidania fulgoroideae]|uniref:30S ribosomal protein S6 n=1 Tax=Candidatus Vidania fulgoroideorum TaxID=881286 RepID=A0A974X9B7_9PROT|nr:30S ribosomal protein S6 [Candidatus Vidania fulgoroideae]